MLAASALLAYFLRPEPHPYINDSGLVLVECFFVAVILTSGRLSSKYPLFVVADALFLFYFGTRLLILIIQPSAFLFASRMSAEVFDSTMVYILLGTSACLLGLALGYSEKDLQRGCANRCSRLAAPEPVPAGLSEPLLMVIFFVSVVMMLVDYFVFGYVGATGSGAHLGLLRRYAMRLLNPTAALVVGLAYYLRRGVSTAARRSLLILISVFTAYKYITGNRGALFEVAVLLLCTGVFFRGNVRIHVRRVIFRAALLIVFGMLVSIPMYKVITEFRLFYWYGGEHISTELVASWLRNAVGKWEDYYQDLLDLSYRINLFESTAVPLHYRDLGCNDVSDLVNLKKTVMLTIERIIPGDVFPEPMLFTEFAFGVFYRRNIGALTGSLVSYIGYEWGPFGISYQLFGYAGGLAFVFGFSALLAFICRKLKARSGTLLADALGLFATLTVYEWIRNLGLDNLVDRSFSFSILLFLYVLVVSRKVRHATAATLQRAQLSITEAHRQSYAKYRERFAR